MIATARLKACLHVRHIVSDNEVAGGGAPKVLVSTRKTGVRLSIWRTTAPEIPRKRTYLSGNTMSNIVWTIWNLQDTCFSTSSGALLWQGITAADHMHKEELVLEEKGTINTDYSYLHRIFRNLFIRKGFNYGYDWTILEYLMATQ